MRSWPKGAVQGGDSPRGLLGRRRRPEQCTQWGALLPQAQRWWERALVELQLIQDHEQLPLGLLKLLLGFNYCEWQRIDLARGFCSVLGFGSCRSKFKENRPLFIGLLVWTRRGFRVLQFLSTNRTLIQLHLEDLWKRNELGLVTIREPNSWSG
jgi:hypothetical protein